GYTGPYGDDPHRMGSWRHEEPGHVEETRSGKTQLETEGSLRTRKHPSPSQRPAIHPIKKPLPFHSRPFASKKKELPIARITYRMLNSSLAWSVLVNDVAW